MKYHLITTGISKFWDLDKEILVLGPWCLANPKNKELLNSTEYQIIPSPWKPEYRIKEAADYCRQIYDEVLPILSKQLNFLHQVSYPVEYWRILIGPWLLHFIGIFYDRYKRIEKAFELFPDLYAYVLPKKQCRLIYYDTLDFFEGTLKEPIFNRIGNLMKKVQLFRQDFREHIEGADTKPLL